MKSFILNLLLYFIRVHAQNLTCQVDGGVVSCPPVACLGDQVTFTATVLAAVGSNIWLLPSGTCSSSIPPDSIILTQTAGYCKGVSMTCGPYTATNADPGSPSNPCLTSTLSVTVTSSMTSSVIKAGTRSVVGQNTIVNTTQIMTIAPPGPPNVMAQTIGPDMVQVVVSPSPNGGLPTSYNVTISNSSYTRSHVVMATGSAMVTGSAMANGSAMASGSAMVNGLGLMKRTFYNISAMAINCVGNNSTTVQSYISWSAPSPSPQTTSSVPRTSSTPTPTTPANAAVANHQSQSGNAAAIIGGVVGGVGGAILLAVVVVIVVVVVCKKKKKGMCHLKNTRQSARKQRATEVLNRMTKMTRTKPG